MDATQDYSTASMLDLSDITTFVQYKTEAHNPIPTIPSLQFSSTTADCALKETFPADTNYQTWWTTPGPLGPQLGQPASVEESLYLNGATVLSKYQEPGLNELPIEPPIATIDTEYPSEILAHQRQKSKPESGVQALRTARSKAVAATVSIPIHEGPCCEANR